MSISLQSIKRGTVIRPPRIVLLGIEKVGKALDIETPIPTPAGWTSLRSLRVGDQVFDKTGAVVKVTQTTPVQRDRKCYEVVFKDGSRLVADGEHQWEVLRVDDNKAMVMTTSELLEQGVKHGNKYRFSVPVSGPLQVAPRQQSLRIDPYTLGAWLGDGATSTNVLTIADRDQDIVGRIKCGPARNRQGKCAVYTLIGLKPAMEQAGLLGNKHIPEEYFRAPYEDRLELFRGIMDTDGTVSNDGKACCELLLTNKRLAEDCLHLARTLGIKTTLREGVATLNGRYISAKYRFNFQSDVCPFHTSFKADRWKAKKTKRKTNKNAIVEITPVDSVPVRCIEVDSPTHTYLAGENYTVTHNSTFAAGADKAIFIPITLEEGIDSIDVPRFPVVSTLDQLKECLGVLADEDHDYETVVIDSGTALEPVIWKAVCEEGGVDSIEKYGGGYGKGYTRALEIWNEVEGMLDYLRDEKRMASIIIGHVKVKRFDDPERESYDTYQFDINEKAANSLYRWADCILFANRSVFTRQEDAGFNKKKVKAEDAGERILCTQKTPAHPGGGRGVWGRLEDEIELSWQAFKEACEAARKASEPKKTTTAKK